MEFRNCKWETEKFFRGKFKRLQKMQLAVFMAVPFVSDYISMNACIFVELGNLCDKIADYAMRIVKETEKALGPKSGWEQVFRNRNSLRNLTYEELYKLNDRRD